MHDTPTFPTAANDGVERVDLNTIVGKRYSMEAIKNLISDKLQVINNTVDQQTARQVEKLLAGKQTDVVILNDGSTAKLIILNKPDRGLSIHQMDVRAELRLGNTYLGHTFSDQDKQYLLKYGDMGRPVQLINPDSGLPFKALIGVDADTNRLKLLNVDSFRIPDEIFGKKLTLVQKTMLLEGKALRLNDMEFNGKKFSAYTRLSAAKGGFKYNTIKNQRTQNSLPSPAQPRQQTSINPESSQATNVSQATKPQKLSGTASIQQGKTNPGASVTAEEKGKTPVKKSKKSLRP